MTTGDSIFNVSDWFRGPVNKKMMIPDSDSMFEGIGYWVSTPLSDEHVMIEMSFSVNYQSLKTDDLSLLFNGFKYDYGKTIRNIVGCKNESSTLESSDSSGVVFLTPVGLHNMRTYLFKSTYRTTWKASVLVSRSHKILAEIAEVIRSSGNQIPPTFIYDSNSIFMENRSYYTSMLEEYGEDYMMNLGIVCKRYASYKRCNHLVSPEFDFQNGLGYKKWFIESIRTMAESAEQKQIDKWVR